MAVGVSLKEEERVCLDRSKLVQAILIGVKEMGAFVHHNQQSVVSKLLSLIELHERTMIKQSTYALLKQYAGTSKQKLPLIKTRIGAGRP